MSSVKDFIKKIDDLVADSSNSVYIEHMLHFVDDILPEYKKFYESLGDDIDLSAYETVMTYSRFPKLLLDLFCDRKDLHEGTLPVGCSVYIDGDFENSKITTIDELYNLPICDASADMIRLATSYVGSFEDHESSNIKAFVDSGTIDSITYEYNAHRTDFVITQLVHLKHIANYADSKSLSFKVEMARGGDLTHVPDAATDEFGTVLHDVVSFAEFGADEKMPTFDLKAIKLYKNIKNLYGNRVAPAIYSINADIPALDHFDSVGGLNYDFPKDRKGEIEDEKNF